MTNSPFTAPARAQTMEDETLVINVVKALREPEYRAELSEALEGGVTDVVMDFAADALEAAQQRIKELERRLGGGCDANNGGDHTVMSQGKYKFCAKCGESLRGVRYCHEPRTALRGEEK